MKHMLCIALVTLTVALLGGARGENTVGDARGAQSQVDSLAHEMMAKMMEVEKDYNKRKVPVLAERNEHLKHVDGFWSRTIQNHPSHGHWIARVDREVLPYITDISVIDIDADQHHFRVMIALKQNPFIAEELLWRNITGMDGHATSGVTWLGERRPMVASFFSYFASEPPLLEQQLINDITHVIRYEFYQNPFTYYDLATYDEVASAHHARMGDEL